MNQTIHVGSEPQESLFVRLGGVPAIANLVSALYQRVGADPELSPYFHLSDMDAQRRKLTEMLGEALGGPSAPWLKDLRSAHRNRGITHRHFSLLCGHLIDVLIEAGVDGDDADDVIEWVGRARSIVVTEQ